MMISPTTTTSQFNFKKHQQKAAADAKESKFTSALGMPRPSPRSKPPTTAEVHPRQVAAGKKPLPA